MLRWALVALLACFCTVTEGCAFFKAIGAWAEKQDVQLCLEYKGRHVCVGRKDGAWVFSVEGLALTEEEQAEILSGLGH